MAVVNQPYGDPAYQGSATMYQMPRPSSVSAGRIGASGAGVLMLLLGAWAALVPFIGPVWGWSADGTGSWTWTAAHGWLFLLPGAVAFLGALMVLGGSVGGATGSAPSGAFLSMLAGAWLVIGPVAWPVLYGSHFFGGYGTLIGLSYWIGYSLGPGVLLAMLGAYVMGRPRLLAASAPMVAAPPVA